MNKGIRFMSIRTLIRDGQRSPRSLLLLPHLPLPLALLGLEVVKLAPGPPLARQRRPRQPLGVQVAGRQVVLELAHVRLPRLAAREPLAEDVGQRPLPGPLLLLFLAAAAPLAAVAGAEQRGLGVGDALGRRGGQQREQPPLLRGREALPRARVRGW
jgi:hypothetical protein